MAKNTSTPLKNYRYITLDMIRGMRVPYLFGGLQAAVQ